MIVPEIAVIQFSVLIVSVIGLVSMVTMLVQCVCGKKDKNKQPDTVESQTGHTSVFLDAEALCKLQESQCETNGDQNVDVTPLNVSVGSNNGTLHSRGNSVDLNKDRRSGASSGSSPRPTLSRELPNIPGTHDRGHHSTLPTLPSDTRITSVSESFNTMGGYSSTIDSQRKTSHLHTHLPDIPNGANNASDNHRPLTGSVDTRPTAEDDSKSNDMDDYDHIVEKKVKKARPRSDYDHVVIENGERRIVPAKTKLQENDYAEVQNGDLYEQVEQEVTVIPLSKPNSTSTQNKLQNSSTKEVIKNDSFNNPYNKIKVDDPPYNSIKDDPPYNKIKESDSDTSFLKIKEDAYNVDDPYNTVKEVQDDLDPYNTVNDDTSVRSSVRKKTGDANFTNKVPTSVYDPYSMMVDEERNVSNQTDPYARVGDTESELDDPYNKVVDDADNVQVAAGAGEDYGDDDYATVNKANEIEYAKVNKSTSARNMFNVDNEEMKISGGVGEKLPSPREEIIHDEYATVVKVRKLSPSNPGTSLSSSKGNSVESASLSSSGNAGTSSEMPGTQNGARSDVSSVSRNNSSNTPADNQIPPEPPRDYDDRDEDIDHYNTVAMVTRENSTRLQARKKEPPYNKLSVRESLASMNARAASNTYEYVSSTDNLYATVDGSTGDGSVKRKLQHNTTETISAIADAPAPPSLDSLHETAKQHQDEIRRKNDVKPDYYNLDGTTQCQGHINGHQRTPSGQGHFRTPSGDMMSSSFEGRVPIATEENVELDFDPNYQSVVEDKTSDNTSEFDPNYETVEEAKAKSRYEEINGARPKLVRQHIYEDPDAELKPGETRLENGKIRAHVYEEVKLSNEAGHVRQHVLNQHTYEEVTDIKKKGKKSNSSNNAVLETKGKKSNSSNNAVLETKGKKSNSSNNAVLETNKKKGHERSSSGDWLLFGKRKSGEPKEPKDGKKKTSDKNEDK